MFADWDAVERKRKAADETGFECHVAMGLSVSCDDCVGLQIATHLNKREAADETGFECRVAMGLSVSCDDCVGLQIATHLNKREAARLGLSVSCGNGFECVV